MARGNCIVVSAYELGRRVEGIIKTAQTPKPGTVMMIDTTVALVNGVHTWKIYDRAADGDRPLGPIIVLTEDWGQGKTVSDAYAAGDRAFGYIPAPGDELNMLLGDVAGTADDHALGEALMIDDGTGKLVATTGSPQSTPFVLKEAITDPTSDTLAWVQFGGF